jgi:hypothetical protein
MTTAVVAVVVAAVVAIYSCNGSVSDSGGSYLRLNLGSYKYYYVYSTVFEVLHILYVAQLQS